MRVAMLSGGKDSLYAAFKSWPVDLGLLLVYEFPRPGSHLVNLGKCVETVLVAESPSWSLSLGGVGRGIRPCGVIEFAGG